MDLIKLSATTSTNDYLKKLASTTVLKDFTIVWAEVQTKGKGQMGTQWVAEACKNLTFSIFVQNKSIAISDLFTLNCMVANAVVDALEHFKLTNVCVKWPNDILSATKKIAGVLIENSIKADGSIQVVIGIGINIQQTNFDEYPNASSILKQYGVDIDREELLQAIVSFLQNKLENFQEIIEAEWQKYHERLFKKDMVSTFEDTEGLKFNGIIKEVNRQGQLVIQLENDDLKCFNLKEIKLLY
ncbi:MAG TPA: biotin--[acetyl-CoA-carboxylase] ligase [Flavobacterium sp.]|nr:biotin--[acetyl-CoA-carboxylase] ligase [Flavobacterium sp.]